MSIKEMSIGSSKIGVKYQKSKNPDTDPEMWPTIGEYQIYDDYIYDVMTKDSTRNKIYLDALSKADVFHKIAVDIGTGRDLNWARSCLDAGVKKVYAIEGMKESYEKAKHLISELDLEEKIELIYGISTEIELPEKVDLCISEVISNIGSAEGVCVVLEDARRRFLKDDGFMIPQRCVTKMAAVSLPVEIYAAPYFCPASVPYVEKIFNKVGYPFDVRLCFCNFPKSSLLSDEGIFEDLDFSKSVKTEYSNSVNLSIENAGRLDGLILWVNLYGVIGGDVLDVLEVDSNWLPVYFPLFYPGIDVYPGEEIKINCNTVISDNGIYPDYQIEGIFRDRNGKEMLINYTSSHHGKLFQESHFYRELLKELNF